MSDSADVPQQRALNVNVGILGHVDSGKTSLAKALSSMQSTACFDKNPQSQERGITLDLGFSAFTAPCPDWAASAGFTALQFTLVDCPGHASLIRTIIGGAQIIDMMMLVIDVTKGIQTQTAECIVIGEILAKRLVVVLNKADQLPSDPEERTAALTKMQKRLRAILGTTRWPKVEMVLVSANPAGEGAEKEGLDTLVRTLSSMVPESLMALHNAAATPDDFLLYVDHCFAIKGQGTVLTGTILRGMVSVGGNIEIPHLKEKRKVKSIQMFRQPVSKASRGDRIGMCVTNLNPENIERTILCSPSSKILVTVTSAVARVSKVRFFRTPLETGGKLHITVGHETVMASVRYFEGPAVTGDDNAFSMKGNYVHLDNLPDDSAVKYVPPESTVKSCCEPSAEQPSTKTYYAVLHFDHAVTMPRDATLIGAKLDAEADGAKQCRLALQGHIVHILQDAEEFRNISAVRWKRKTLFIDRITDDFCCIAKGLVKAAEGDAKRFVGMKIFFQSDEFHPVLNPVTTEERPAIPGVIEGTFGSTGKVKVKFTQPIFRKKPGGGVQYPRYMMQLHVKKNQFATHKQLMQGF
eukprot:PhM_4_TR10859/c0_g2_i1/m.13236/K03833/selB, EEFSEC; selenocysteine-specific elongation factor